MTRVGAQQAESLPSNEQFPGDTEHKKFGETRYGYKKYGETRFKPT